MGVHLGGYFRRPKYWSPKWGGFTQGYETQSLGYGKEIFIFRNEPTYTYRPIMHVFNKYVLRACFKMLLIKHIIKKVWDCSVVWARHAAVLDQRDSS